MVYEVQVVTVLGKASSKESQDDFNIEGAGRRASRRRILGIGILFWSVVGLFIISVLLTIIGSSLNNDMALNVGIITWLTTSFLFFIWLVIWIWSHTSRYDV